MIMSMLKKSASLIKFVAGICINHIQKIEEVINDPAFEPAPDSGITKEDLPVIRLIVKIASSVLQLVVRLIDNPIGFGFFFNPIRV